MNRNNVPYEKIVFVCLNERESGVCCAGGGAKEIHEQLKAAIKEHDLGAGIRVVLDGDGIAEPNRVFDKALICVGRNPNSKGMNLHDTRITTDKRGFIEVDAQRRTAEPHIFAVGDVVGEPMLAHKASAEGKVAAEVIAGRKSAFEPQAIPAVVFTDPELAWCGLTENIARDRGVTVTVARFPWAASGARAR